jgi:hypothetical protein
MTRVYRNDETGFTDIGATNLPGLSSGAVAWGDFDNDGDLDILLSGYLSDYPTVSRVAGVFRNDRGVFADIGAGLPAVSECSVAWGDFDSDGDLDFVLSGDTGSGLITRIYRNDSGGFTDIGAGLPGLIRGSTAWGDYDNDGDLDLLLTGYSGGTAIARVYRNDGGIFVDANVGLLSGIYSSAAAWADYDSDGDLDIILSQYVFSYQVYVYRNDSGVFNQVQTGLPGLISAAAWGDFDNDGRLDLGLGGGYAGISVYRSYVPQAATNPTTPSPPSGLSAVVINNGVSFSWQSGSDAQTPTAGLTYNLRVGTLPGGVDVVSPHSDPVTGRLRVPQMGNAQHRRAATLTNLSVGTYYWSVQTVDGTFAGSGWAPEQAFVVTTGPPVAVTLPASDVLCCSASLRGQLIAGGLPASAWFEWGATTNFGNATPVRTVAAGLTPEPFGESLTGLLSRTRYYFRLAVSNAVDVRHGTNQTFVTGDRLPAVTTLPASNITASSATLFGFASSPDTTVTLFFEWGTTTNYGQATLPRLFGAGLTLDGQDDYVSAGPGRFPSVSNTFALELWAAPTAGLRLVTETNNGIAALGSQRFAVFPDHGDLAGYAQPAHVGVGVSVGTNGVIVAEHTAGFMPPVLVHTGSLSGWTHVAVVYSNGLPRLYLNGTLARTGLVTGKTAHPSANLAWAPFGSFQPGTYGVFAGRADELRVWREALAPATIQGWMGRELTAAHPNYGRLLLYWPLNEGQGLTAADASGNNLAGALNGGPLWIGDTPLTPPLVSAELSGLAPGTWYHFRLVGMNSGGTAYGTDQSFRTSWRLEVLGLSVQPDGGCRLQFSGDAWATYALEVSTNLTFWTPLTNLVAGPEGLFEFLDTTATNFPSRFYRLRTP